MKVIPAETKVVVVRPEQYILEVGDKILLNDLSFLMIMKHDPSAFSGFSCWAFDYNNTINRFDDLSIEELGLKVPCPKVYNSVIDSPFQLDIQRNIVYLDTIITNNYGNYWLTRLKYLKPKGLEHG